MKSIPPPPTPPTIQSLLLEIQDAVDALPLPSVPLVAAIVAMQAGMPSAFYELIMGMLQRRSDLREVSPAAEALMRVLVYSKHQDGAFAEEEIRIQTQLLKALGQERQLYAAASFMRVLAEKMALLAQCVHGISRAQASLSESAELAKL